MTPARNLIALSACLAAGLLQAAPARGEVYADFGSGRIDSRGLVIVPGRNFRWDPQHGGWGMPGISGAFALRYSSKEPVLARLRVRHMTSRLDQCRGGGYSPVTIAVRGVPVAESFDPASAHGGSHSWVTDSWKVRLERGVNEIAFETSRQCSAYFVRRVDLEYAGPAPERAEAAGASAGRRLEAGLAAYDRGDFSGAIIAFNKALSEDPDLEEEVSPRLADAYARRGLAAQAAGDPRRARADLDEALRLGPGTPALARAAAEALARPGYRPPAAPGGPFAAPDRSAQAARAVRRLGELQQLHFAEKGRYSSDAIALMRLAGDASELREELQSSLAPGSLRIEAGRESFLISALVRDGGGAKAEISSADFGGTAKPPVSKGGEGEPLKKRLPLLIILAPAALFLLLLPWKKMFRPARQASLPPGRPGTGGAAQPPPAAPAPAVSAAEGLAAAFREQGVPAAAAAAREGRYKEALDLLTRKPRQELTLADYNLLLECYLQLGDAERAALVLSTVEAEISEVHRVVRGPGGPVFTLRRGAGRFPADRRAAPELRSAAYAELAALAAGKGRRDLASKLYRMAADCLLTTQPPGSSGEKYYALADALEAAGELPLAAELFGLAAHSDSAGRLARLRIRSAMAAEPAPPQPAQAQPPAPQPPRAVTLDAQPAPAGLLAGRYEFRGAIGAGGMAVIYEGRDKKTGAAVAIKRMHAFMKEGQEGYERFRQEAKIVGGLDHPNIVGLKQLVEQDGDLYLVFDFVAGKTLYAVLKERQRLSLEECKKVFSGVCEAVHYAHSRGVIHRDLKPANIMLTAGDRAMVMDFGLASELREGLTRVSHHTMSGTPAYMAPEQLGGVVKRESDIYAMGICLYEALTGALPFNDLDTLKQKKLKDYKPAGAQLPWLPAGVDEVISVALDPEPSQRYAGALDFWNALKDL